MKFKSLLLTIFISGILHGQTIHIQYMPVSANEIRFEAVYEGDATEIMLPERGRLISYDTEKADTSGSSIKTKVNNTPIRFTYSFITSSSQGLGSSSENWFPKLKENNDKTVYSIMSANLISDIMIYPYTEISNGRFSFTEDLNPKFLDVNNIISQFGDQEFGITLFDSMNFPTGLETIQEIYDFFAGYLGKLDINHIIIVNNRIVSQETFIKDKKLYILMPVGGTIPNIKDMMVNAWNRNKEEVSPRIFSMFKDSLIRLNILEENKNEIVAKTTETTGNEESITNAETSAEEQAGTLNILTQEDPVYILPVAPKEYYNNLLTIGFTNNSIVDVNVPGIINNFGLLHMAWYHVGIENFLAGIKGYFNSSSESETTQNAEQTQSDTETQNTENTVSETNQTEKKQEGFTGQDTERINWDIITQNKVQEPYFSLYTKEVLHAPTKLPILKGLGSKVSRSSFNIPDLALQGVDGNVVDIKWDNFRVANINIKNGSYDLDPERRIPQFSMIDSYYTFDKQEEQERRLVLFASERTPAPGERNLKQHLDMIKLTATQGNAFDIPEGSTVYVVISHILSSSTGLLKDAFKESIIAIDPETKRVKHIATRLRI